MQKRLWQAVQAAVQAHEGEYRKVVRIPYVIHPMRVAGILAAYGLPEDPFVLAALLHDAPEHGRMELRAIEEQFGPEVARLVAGVTPLETGSWRERKAGAVARLRDADPAVLILACADKLDSLISIRDDSARLGEAKVWNRLRREPNEMAWYHGAIAEVMDRRGDGAAAAAPLFAEYGRMVRELFGEIRF
jgi:(p)ppGpp synthase/HD superfamily hydrolase